EILRRIGRVKPSRSFRSAFQYQSIMFIAAGHAVAKVSGQPWSEFVRQRLFQPLGMTAAVFTTAGAKQAADHASPHRLGERGWPEVMPWYEMAVPNPAGSIHASARDLCQWVRFHLGDGVYQGKRLLSTAQMTELHSPQMVIRREGQAKEMN